MEEEPFIISPLPFAGVDMTSSTSGTNSWTLSDLDPVDAVRGGQFSSNGALSRLVVFILG